MKRSEFKILEVVAQGNFSLLGLMQRDWCKKENSSLRWETGRWEFLFLWLFFSPLQHEDHLLSPSALCLFSPRRQKNRKTAKKEKITKIESKKTAKKKVRITRLELSCNLQYFQTICQALRLPALPWLCAHLCVYVCVCVIWLDFIRVLNTPFIFYPAYSHCFLAKHMFTLIKWLSWLFSCGLELCVHSGKAIPLSNILYAYLQTELFREHLCEGTVVFLISFLKSKNNGHLDSTW